MNTLSAFLGKWTLNRAKSQYELGQPPKIGTYLIEAEGEGLKVTMQWTSIDEQEFSMVYHSIPDGQQYPYTENPAVDAMMMEQVDERTLDTSAYKDGQVVSFARRALSEDGKTMTITMSGKTADGKDYRNLAIYEK